MALLIIIFLIITFLAIYPLIRDAIRKRYQPELDFSLALELIIAGKKEAALEKLKGIVRRNSEFIDAYLYLSDLYLEKGDFHTAMAIGERLAFRRNLTREKERKILKHLARLYVKGKRYLKAISILEELIKIEKDPEALSTLFALYLKEENLPAAEKIWEDLVKTNKRKIPLFYAELGKAFLKKEEKKGLAYLEKGKNSENPIPSLLYLAEYYASINEPEKSLAHYEKVIEKEPSSFKRIKDKMEELYYSLGRYEELEDIYRRWIRSHPEILDFFLALSQIYIKKELPEEAIKVLEQYKGREKNYLLHLLAAYLSAGKLEKSRMVLEDLIKRDEVREKTGTCSYCQTELEVLALICPNCLSWFE